MTVDSGHFSQICHKRDKFSKVLKRNLKWKTYQLGISYLAISVSRQEWQCACFHLKAV
jgi:hypothetical protein